MTSKDSRALRVRPARVADAVAVARLLGQLGYPATPERAAERVRRFARHPDSAVLVAVDGDDAVVGLASVTALPLFAEAPADWCRISALVVDERLRGRGVGERLVRAAEDFARERGCVRVEVSSGTHRPAAHRFYERLGYREQRARFLKELTSEARATQPHMQ